MLNRFNLKNGLKVATYSIPQMRSVFVGLGVKGGSIIDTEKNAGVAHFMEHLLVQGIPSLPNVEEFSNYIEQMAGSYSAVTHPQTIRFSANAPATKIKDLLKIASEVMFEPLFAEDAIERERGVILEEIRERQDELWYKNNQFFSKVRYRKGHPLLIDGGGTEVTISKLTRQDLVEYWSNFFFPDNVYLVVVGGFKSDETKKDIEEIFSRFDSKKTFPGFPKLTNNDLSDWTVALRHDPELKTCSVDITFPSISDQETLEDRMPQYILRSILGGLRSSRLYRLLRQRKGLVYGVGFGGVSYDNFGYCYASSQALVDKVEEVIRLMAAEIKGFYTNGPTKEELEFAKNYSINRALMSFDHPSSIASWVEGDLMWEEKIYTPEEYTAIVEKVTQEDIIASMKKYWDFSKLNLTIQGPIPNTKANVKKFEQLIGDLKP